MVRARGILGASVVVSVAAALGLAAGCGSTASSSGGTDGGPGGSTAASSAATTGGHASSITFGGSSSVGATSAGSGSSPTLGASCVALAACCPQLSGENAVSCAGLATTGNDASCAMFLTAAQAGGSCTGASSSGSLATSATTGSVTPDGGATSSTSTTGASTTSVASTSTTSGVSSASTHGSRSTTTSSSESSSTSTESSTSTSSGSCRVYKLYPETVAGVFCPFTANDGGHTFCEAGQVCVEPDQTDAGTYPPSYCAATGAANATNIDCLEAIDCASSPAGNLCCGTGTLEPLTCNGTSENKVKDFGGTTCATSCSGFTICEVDRDCTSGQTCVPTEAYGNDFGVCSSS